MIKRAIKSPASVCRAYPYGRLMSANRSAGLFLLSFCLAVGALLGSALPVFASPAQQQETPESLVFLFQKQKDPLSLRTEADEMAKALSAEVGVPVTARIPADYAASVQALVSGTADIAYVDSMSYLLAERDASAQILLAETRPNADGVLGTSYDSLFVVPKNSALTSLEDVKAQASSLTFAFTSPTSTSGYIIPSGRMMREGIVASDKPISESFKRVVFAGNYGAALEQVASGLADIATVSSYSFEGAAADKYLSADKRSALRVLARTPGVPTHVIIARGGVPPAMRQRVSEGLLRILAKNPKLLSDVYGAAGLTVVNPAEHVKVTRSAASLLKIDLK